jgi:hypothetical protein
MALVPELTDVEAQQHAIHDRAMQKIEVNPRAAEKLNGVSMIITARNATDACDRNLRHDDERVDE